MDLTLATLADRLLLTVLVALLAIGVAGLWRLARRGPGEDDDA